MMDLGVKVKYREGIRHSAKPKIKLISSNQVKGTLAFYWFIDGYHILNTWIMHKQ